MARITPDFARKEYLRSFAGMSRLAQDAVIEALETIRDVTHPEAEPNGAKPDQRQFANPGTSLLLSEEA